MKLSNLSFAILALSLLVSISKAEETQKPDAPKPVEVKPTDAAATDKPKTPDDPLKVPEGTSPLNAAHENESLLGDLSKGPPVNGKGKDKAAKKAAKKGLSTDALVLHIEVHGGDKKEAKRGKDVTLTASGDVLTQLTAFAEKHAHIKVTGALDGDKMTVKEVSEAPAEPAGKKKKKNNA